jgi:metallo-beta-lactamase family protein
MRVHFLGATRTVTGSAFLLEKGPLKWLVDCGMFQGGKEIERRNRNIRPYRPKELNVVLLTHAHIDHSGLIPKLVRGGFRGKILCTQATFDLCDIMLRDSAHIQEMEAEWQNRKNRRSAKEVGEPLYTVKDAEESLRYFQTVRYDEIFAVGEGVRVRFRDAGHILGSAIIEVWVEENGEEKKLVFSGDLGQTHRPLVRDPSTIEEADTLWLESTYGDRVHKSREETEQELLRIIQDAIDHQSKVIIPAFAVDRTQSVIYTLGGFIRENLIPPIPIYIDSPLAISATEIFKKNSDCFDEETRSILLGGENPLELPQIIYARTTEESKAINEDSRPGIIVSASGMLDSGRIKHHLKHHLWRPESHIVIIGYQAEGTLGRRIIEGAKTVRLFGEDIAVQAQIHTLGGFSAHADQRGLLEWLSHFRNPHLEVFVIHGGETVSLEFARLVRDRFHFRTSVPQWGEQRVLFGPEATVATEPFEPERKEEMEEERQPSSEVVSRLLRELDRSFKKLRRKLKRGRIKEKLARDLEQLKGLEEIHEKMEEMESRLD